MNQLQSVCWRPAFVLPRLGREREQLAGYAAHRLRVQARATGAKRSKTQEDPLQRPKKFWPVLASLGIVGATTGPCLDGIHSRVQLIIYDRVPLEIGNLHTSAFVPVLLSLYYVVIGSLFYYFDYRASTAGDPATLRALQRSSLSKMALSFGALAAVLAISSALYERHTPVGEISTVLTLLAAVNYLVFDGTKQGLALATLCALGAPASELVLMHVMHLWHYPEANVFLDYGGGIVSWTIWAYFAYTPALANLTRYLIRVL